MTWQANVPTFSEAHWWLRVAFVVILQTSQRWRCKPQQHLPPPRPRAMPAYCALLKPYPRSSETSFSLVAPSLKVFTSQMMGELIILKPIYLILLWKTRCDSTRNQNISLVKSSWPVQNYLWFTLHFKHYLKSQQGETWQWSVEKRLWGVGWL